MYKPSCIPLYFSRSKYSTISPSTNFKVKQWI